MFCFCKHDWKLLDKTVIPSKIQVLKGAEGGTISATAFPLDLYKMSEQKIIITFTCSKCGKMNTITKSNWQSNHFLLQYWKLRSIMTVQELIEELKQCPPDKEVVLICDYGDKKVENVVCGDDGPVELY